MHFDHGGEDRMTTTICTDATGLVFMIGDNSFPEPPDGGSRYVLAPSQVAAYRALASSQNGGITFDGTTFAALPFVPPPAIDPSNSDNLNKQLKAILLAAAGMAGKTPAQAKQAFLAAWQALP
jgi:hypothetical protein